MNAPTLRWRAPGFTAWQGPGGTIDDRERLGLPDRFLATDLQSQLIAATGAVRDARLENLLDMIAAPRLPLAFRIAAGNMLALAGDPRINPLVPDMIEIPGGPVRVGMPAEAIDAGAYQGVDRRKVSRESPRHTVMLTPFRLARFPVTNREYRSFLEYSGWKEIPTGWVLRRYPAERANHPVHTVSARAADAYAAWLAQRTGRRFRLPTEVEWEFAATGPGGRDYPWGDRFDPALANTAECGLLDTAPVGVFAGGEGPFGHADLAGNVEEYVADGYAPDPGIEAAVMHPSASDSAYRVARGGCFTHFADVARTRRRHGHNPRSAAYATGFRLAETI